MLSALRYFERAIKSADTSKESFNWGLVEMPSLGNCLLCICRTLLEIIKKEPRLIRVQSPTYVVGEFIKGRSMVSFWMCLTCNNFRFGRKMHLHCLGSFFFCAVFVLDKPFAKFFFSIKVG